MNQKNMFLKGFNLQQHFNKNIIMSVEDKEFEYKFEKAQKKCQNKKMKYY